MPLPKFRSLAVTAGLGLCLFVSPAVRAEDSSPDGAALDAVGQQYINAALWQQTAAERKALCYQTYNTAARVIAAKIDDGSYAEHGGRLCEDITVQTDDGRFIRRSRPLAIILDLDETVFDNSIYESWMTLHPSRDSFFNLKRFFAYQASLEHPPLVPGALEFLTQCRAWGVTPIYVTDRDEADFRGDCLRTLRHAGLDSPTLEQELFCRNKAKDKADAEAICAELRLGPDDPLARDLTQNAGSKSVRRWLIGSRYKVLATFGDDLYDHPVMVDRAARGREAREQRGGQVRQNAKRFGVDWFILPNAMYGSWRDKSGFPLTDPGAAVEALREAGQPFDDWLRETKASAKD